MKHPGGRPPKPPSERLSEVLNFRVTEAEADAVHRAALRAGVSVREYLRARLVPQLKLDRAG